MATSSSVTARDTFSVDSDIAPSMVPGVNPSTWSRWSKQLTVYEPAVATPHFLPVHLQYAHRFACGDVWNRPVTGAMTTAPQSTSIIVPCKLNLTHDTVHGHFDFQWRVDPRASYMELQDRIILAGDDKVPVHFRNFLLALKGAQPGSVKSVSIQFAGFQWNASTGSSSVPESAMNEEEYLTELAAMDAHSPEYAWRCKAMEGTLYDESRGACGPSMYRVLPTLVHSALAPHVPYLEHLQLTLLGTPHATICYNQKMDGHRILNRARFDHMVSAVCHDLNLLRLLCKPMIQPRMQPDQATSSHNVVSQVEFVYAIMSPYNLRMLVSPCHMPLWEAASNSNNDDDLAHYVLQRV